MMEVAKTGVLIPENFTFKEVIIVFAAVMVTDVLLLNTFNSLGLPTSTTVSIIFELLGGAIAMACLKVWQSGAPFTDLGTYLNSGKALAMILAILISVLVAFISGVVVQWVLRLIFTFHYERIYKWLGGIFSGVAFTMKKLRPSIRIYGVQASGAASMLVSHEHKHIETLPSVNTIADGIAVKSPGNLTFSLAEQYVDEIVTVSDDEIAVAILDLMEAQKLVSEGAGAVAVAAALSGKIPLKGKKTALIVSGGNIDVTILSRVIDRALIKEGRIADITIELIDKPGQLVEVSSIIASKGANVTGVFHDKNGNEANINNCTLRVKMETRDRAHIEEIKDALASAGFKIVGAAR